MRSPWLPGLQHYAICHQNISSHQFIYPTWYAIHGWTTGSVNDHLWPFLEQALATQTFTQGGASLKIDGSRKLGCEVLELVVKLIIST